MKLLIFLLFSFGLLSACSTTQIPLPKSVLTENSCVISVPHEYWLKDLNDWNITNNSINLCNKPFLIINTQGYGGYIRMATDFMNTVRAYKRRTGGYVIMRLHGTGYSAHAYHTCVADRWIPDSGARLMFHAVRGPFNNILYSDTRDMLNVCSRYISDDVKERVLNGEDVYVNNPHYP